MIFSIAAAISGELDRIKPPVGPQSVLGTEPVVTSAPSKLAILIAAARSKSHRVSAVVEENGADTFGRSLQCTNGIGKENAPAADNDQPRFDFPDCLCSSIRVHGEGILVKGEIDMLVTEQPAECCSCDARVGCMEFGSAP